MNVLSEEKKQQAIVLGRLGWSLRRIQCAIRIRRETAAGHLKAAGIPLRPPGQWGRQQPQVSTRQGTGNQLQGTDQQPARHPSASACEPYRAIIEAALSKGRSAMCIFQDLVDKHGFPGKSSSVKRFVRKLRGLKPLKTGLMFPTTIGEDRLARRLMARQSAFNWMRKVLQGEFTPTLLCSEMGRLPGLDKLLTTVTEGRLSDRNRALAVLARNKGFSL